MSRAAAVRRFAAAKLNLHLHVTGRRPDGYHELDSLVVFLDLGDTLPARPDAALSLAVEGPFAAPLMSGLAKPEDNLVWRAAHALAAAAAIAAAHRQWWVVACGLAHQSTDAAGAMVNSCSRFYSVPRAVVEGRI